MSHQGGYRADPRIHWLEWTPWIVAIVCFFALPEYLSLGARILIYILFALSLDLALGYAGIVTLGHAAFFGAGAYTVGIATTRIGGDPFVWVPVAGLVAAAFAALLGVIAMASALWLPRGLWGAVAARTDFRLFPVGYVVRDRPPRGTS